MNNAMIQVCGQFVVATLVAAGFLVQDTDSSELSFCFAHLLETMLLLKALVL